MTNSKIIYDNLIHHLRLNEPEDEVSAIAFEVLDHFGISKTDIIAQKATGFNYEQLHPLIERLNNHEPVQYILGTAWFCGYKFSVNPSVLIPRPETEMLVEEAIKFKSSNKEFSILDIGTGSGCIAISLALMFPEAQVMAIDVSEAALAVAKHNANKLNAHVNFVNLDILSNDLPNHSFDLIVSNPPYIGASEMSTISKNVLDYEPHLALFVKEPDPLVFYRAISNMVTKNLNAGGEVLVEINERFGPEIKSIFKTSGLSHCQILMDLSGKNRIVRALKI